MGYSTIFEADKVEIASVDTDFTSPGKLAFLTGATGNVGLITWGGYAITAPVEIVQVLNIRVKRIVSADTTVVGDIYVGFQ